MDIKTVLVAGSLSILAFALISNRAERNSVTAPMVFVSLDLLMYMVGMGNLDLSHGFIHGFMEITLILVLFTDASRIQLGLLLKEHKLPLRMLLMGMPLTILLGALGAQWMFGFENIWAALLLAAILAPTDAALGQVVVSAREVPVRIRQTLNVESGLNDGIALPVILVFLALFESHAGHSRVVENGFLHWSLFTGKQLIFGPLVGAAVGWIGGRLIDWSTRTEWMSHTFRDLSLMSFSFMAFGLAEMVGGNGFIAAFFAGLTLGNSVQDHCDCLYEFAESEGQLMTLMVFMVIGMVVLPEFQSSDVITVVVYAFLSLTLFRMLPVGLSLMGLKLKYQSVLFLGWFGPRGLASILFALLLVEELQAEEAKAIFSIVLATVFLSIFLHGISAGPAARIYSRIMAKGEGERLEEHKDVCEMPIKHESSHSH